METDLDLAQGLLQKLLSELAKQTAGESSEDNSTILDGGVDSEQVRCCTTRMSSTWIVWTSELLSNTVPCNILLNRHHPY